MLIQPPLTSPSIPNPRQRPQYAVYTKTNWADDWTLVKYLEAISATDAAAPSVPRAHFRWRAGMIKWEDQKGFSPQALQNGLLDQFVMIKVIPITGGAPFPLWVGRFYENNYDFAGTSPGGVTNADQDLVAHGLAHELDREMLKSAYITNDGATALKVEASIPFNEKIVKGFREIGNRSSAQIAVNGQNTYVFGNSWNAGPGTYYPWSALDVVNYLLACFSPASTPFVVGGQTDALAKTILPRLPNGRQTVFQLLNQVIDRRRGLVWCIRTTGSGKIEVHIQTVFEKDIVADGVSIKANGETVSLDLTGDQNLTPVVKAELDSLTRYGTIVVGGGQIVSMFTVSFADETLVEGWTGTKQAAYNNAGTGTALAASNTLDSDLIRTFPQFEHVYTTFKIPATWDWLAGGGLGHGRNIANPLPDATGRIAAPPNTAAAPARTWGHTLLRSLPIEKDQANRSDPDGLEPEYEQPMVFVFDENQQQYIFAHQPGPGVPNAHIRMLDHDFGFEVRFHMNHVLALRHFIPVDGVDGSKNANLSSVDPTYDYLNMIATVATQTDQRLQVTATIPGVDPAQVLHIDVEDAELWYAVPYTIIGLTDGSPYGSSPGKAANQFNRVGAKGATLRDDSQLLRQIAAMAQAWYGVPRSCIQVEAWDILTHAGICTLITTMDDVNQRLNVNTVVTELEWDLQEMKTTLRTRFAELDFGAFANPDREAQLR